MRMIRRVLIFAVLFLCGHPGWPSPGAFSSGGDETLYLFVAHKFSLWGSFGDKDRKLDFLMGWANGFFQDRTVADLDFGSCLESMTTDQAIAMIDEYYQDHPELWSVPIGKEILQALTVKGGPCEGKRAATRTGS